MQRLRGFNAVVRFSSPLITLVVRPPSRREKAALTAYVCHSVGCLTCSQLIDPTPAVILFCPDGRDLARKLEELFYIHDGQVRSISRGEAHCVVIVEICPAFRRAEILIRAMHHGRRCKARVGQAAHDSHRVNQGMIDTQRSSRNDYLTHAVARPPTYSSGDQHQYESTKKQRARSGVLEESSYFLTRTCRVIRSPARVYGRPEQYSTHEFSPVSTPRFSLTRPADDVRVPSQRSTRERYSLRPGEEDFSVASSATTLHRRGISSPFRLAHMRDQVTRLQITRTITNQPK